LISIICAYFILIYWPVLLLTSCAVYVFLWGCRTVWNYMAYLRYP
jgi:hypothetical protein